MDDWFGGPDRRRACPSWCGVAGSAVIRMGVSKEKKEKEKGKEKEQREERLGGFGQSVS